MEKHVNSALTEEERREYHVTEEEMTLLTGTYKLRFRTATEFGAFDNHIKRWILKMMETAYKAGQNERK